MRPITIIIAGLALASSSFAHTLPVGARALPVNTKDVYMVAPQYPLEARSRHITGSGEFILLSNPSTGKVYYVNMTKSTGSAVLDLACVNAFLQWRLPKSWKGVRMPVTFTMTGAQY